MSTATNGAPGEPCKTCGKRHAGEGGTPPPWSLHTQDRQIDIRGEDGAVVATLKRGYLGRPLAGADADARLIVAAPRLLAALREIRRNTEPWEKADNMAGRLGAIAGEAIDAIEAAT